MDSNTSSREHHREKESKNPLKGNFKNGLDNHAKLVENFVK